MMTHPADIEIRRELNRLCTRMSGDFAALAVLLPGVRQMKWQYLWGSRSVRTCRLTVAPGVGLAGMVLRHGTTCRIDGSSGGMKAAECPVMLAEKLTAAIAFALPPVRQRIPGGVLLVGRRTGRPFGVQEIGEAAALLPNIHQLLQSSRSEEQTSEVYPDSY